MNQDDTDNKRDDALIDDRFDSHLPRARQLMPRGPKKYRVEKVGSGVRVTVTDWGPVSAETAGTSVVSYLVYWAETVDASNAAGIAAGFARATVLAPPIPATGKEDGEASAFFADPKYLIGYFYCIGVDGKGNRSAAGAPVQITSGTGGTVPPDVEHFLASESGEQHNLTTISAVSYSFRIPANGAGIDRVQFYFNNYPNYRQLSEGQSVRATAGAGGTQTGKIDLPVGRRKGVGTVTVTPGTPFSTVAGVGTNFVAQAQLGDVFEVFGIRATIVTAITAGSMTLSTPAGWTGPAVVAAADWWFLSTTTIYAVSVGVDGARRDDVTNAPSQTVTLDGDLSAPVAPSLVASTLGNAIRLDVTPAAGTQLARILLYRATGTVTPFAKATFAVIHSWEIDTSNPSQSFQHDDSAFTVYQRENGQVFSYAATAVNVREMESAASTIINQACRLDAPSDGGPQVPSREIARNLLWDAMLSGTAGAVGLADVVQDSNMGTTPPFGGFARWNGVVLAGGSAPSFINTTEVLLAMTIIGGAGTSSLEQIISVWNNATAANRHVPKGKFLVLQFKLRTSGGTPGGSVFGDILMYNGAAQVGQYWLRQRLSNDSFDYTAAFMQVAGSDIVTDHHVVYGVFSPSQPGGAAIPATVTDIKARIYYQTNNWNGVNVLITEPMLSVGEALAQWTADLVDPKITYPPPGGGAPIPPGSWKDRDGRTGPSLEISL